jgi:hypothetical protein
MKKLLLLATVVLAGAATFVAVIGSPLKSLMPATVITNDRAELLRKNFGSYKGSEKEFESNSESLKQELVPPCPSYDASCLLNAALTRLDSHGYAEDAAFATLIDLSDTIARYSDKELMGRVLKILQTQRTKFPFEDRGLLTGIMKLQFALGNFEEGFSILQKLKGPNQGIYAGDVPQIAAIYFLQRKGDLDHANEVAVRTKGWPFDPVPFSGPAFMNCFSSATKSDSIIRLILENLKAKNNEGAQRLIPLLTESGSSYFSTQTYGTLLYEISNYYRDTPSAQPAPEFLCKDILNNLKTSAHASSEFIKLDRIGCKNESVIAAKWIKDKVGPPKDSNEIYYDIARITLGEGDQMLEEAGHTEDKDKRFEKYFSLIKMFHDHDMVELEEKAKVKAIETGDGNSRQAISNAIRKRDRNKSQQSYLPARRSELQGDAFVGLWGMKMKTCLGNSILQLKTSDPAIVGPACVSDIVSTEMIQ